MKIAIHASQHEKPGQLLNRIREMFAADGWDIFVADPPTPDAIREPPRDRGVASPGLKEGRRTCRIRREER